MPNLLDLSQEELTAFFTEELGEPPFRARQIWPWLWQKLERNFSEMTDLSVKARAKLEDKACILWPKIVDLQISQDQTKKFLLELEDGERIETVLIPSVDHEGRIRWAQCLSTQVGCPMGCTFCATGSLGFSRNLTVSEILGQVLIGKEHLKDYRSDHPILRNLVFMGMGEPLLNLTNLLRSLTILNDPKGLAFSPRRITVSTCGIEEGLLRLGASGLCYLAVSLHAPNQELRERLMPRAALLPLDRLIDLLSNYPVKTRERITFEYLLLKGVNDTPKDAHALAKIVHRVNGKLNLIVYNPTPGSPYAAPDSDRVLAFEQILWSHHVTAIARASHGKDIDAACGQLRARHETKP